MKIGYCSKKLEKILTDERLIKKYYTNIYANLVSRLKTLSIVSNLSLISNLPPTRRHKLSGDYNGCWSIDISKNYRLIIKPHESQIGLNDYEVTHIEVVDIVDYH